jgi:hypothetical protein
LADRQPAGRLFAFDGVDFRNLHRNKRTMTLNLKSVGAA